MTQMNTATTRFTCANSMRRDRLEHAGQPQAQSDAGQDAQPDPDGQVTFEQTHGEAFSFVDAAT